MSNLAQGLLTLVAMTGPLLTVLHLIPQGVLAGLFFIMGFQALEANGITAKLLFLLRDEALTPPNHSLRRKEASRVRRSAVWAFVVVELVGFGATFAITQTVAAVGFPVFILALIPVRTLLLPKWLRPEELAVLDEPTAGPFVMESVGGSYGGGGGAAEERDDAADVLDGRRNGEQSSGGEETEMEWERRKEKDGEGMGRRGGGGGSGRLSEEELAELGESRSGVVRRRLSVLNRDEGP